MNKEITESKIFIGQPLSFKDKLYIYPPTVAQVLGSSDYDIYRAYFLITQESIVDQITDFGRKQVDEQLPTPFQLIMGLALANPKTKKQLEDGFFFFTHQFAEIVPDKQMVIFGDITKAKSLDDLFVLRAEDFPEFQNMCRMVLGYPTVEHIEEDLNPRVQRFKAKARYRDYIKNKTGETIPLNKIISAVCCMNVGLTPLNIGEITYAALLELFSTNQKKEAYDWQMRLMISGNTKKPVRPKYWIETVKV